MALPPGPRILFLARSLGIGGTERQLVALAIGLHERSASVTVATFYSGGELERELVLAGIEVVDLGKRGRWDLLRTMFRLAQVVRRIKPHFVYSMLDGPNVAAALLKLTRRRPNVIWGIRASNLELESLSDRFQRNLRYDIQRFLAPLADRIICNSHAGKEHMVQKGFPQSKMVVVPNGIDTDYFRFTESGRRTTRHAWGIRDDQRVVGMVARLDPIKDHETFLRAAAKIAAVDSEVVFVCIGSGSTKYSNYLKELSAELLPHDRIIWTGDCGHMPDVYSALDLLVLSSLGEGFPNVIGEAMSCGIPCVATDVGDCASIIDVLGCVVPRASADELSLAVGSRLRDTTTEKTALAARCRSRILREYSIPTMLDNTLGVLRASNTTAWLVR